MTFFWFAVAYITAYKLGEMKGEVKERDRDERAVKKMENRVINIRERR